jgi:hypothetical protein
LRRQLGHRDPDALKAALFAVFIGYRSNPSAAADYEMTIDAYVAVLSDVPVWAAITACRDWPRGKYDDEHTSARHPPTTAELHRAAKTEAAAAERELERLMRTGGVTYRAAVAVDEEPVQQSPKVRDGFDRLREELAAGRLDALVKELPNEIKRRERYDAIAAARRSGFRKFDEEDLSQAVRGGALPQAPGGGDSADGSGEARR